MSGADTPLDGDYVIAVERLSKTFSGTRVLSDVSVGIPKNEIHALIGGNGSGKSTLIKILAGVVPPDSGGTVIAAGRTIAADRWTPRDARAAHLRFVHQDLGIFRDLSIADNLSAGGSYQTRRGRIRWSEVHDHARECLKRHGISADPRVPLSALNLAEQTMVAIVRALQDVEQDAAACVVLDEPTAALPVADARWLLTKLRELAGSGHAIMLVTHHMDEVLSCSDSVTILRDGLRVHTGRTGDLNRSDIIQMILGSAAPTPKEVERSTVSGSVKLKTTNLTSGKARQVSLTLRTGEIVGLTGVLGSGFKDIPRSLFGLDSAATGIVTLDGDEIKPRSPADAMEHGIAFLPGDRLRDGIFAELSVLENVTAASTIAGGRLRLRHRSERRRAQTLIDRFRVRPPRLHPSIQSLSGGNQQRVLLARWAARSPRLLLLDDPTSGVDVGARTEIWELLTARSRQDGLSILVSSSDVEELSWYCDRVLVFGDGRVDCELVRDDLSPSRITHAIYDASWKTAT